MSMQSSSNQIGLHLPNPEKSLQFCRVEESEFDNLFHDHIQGEDENVKDVQMDDHLRPMEEPLRIPILGIEDVIIVPTVLADQFELKLELLDFVTGGNLMTRNTQEAFTTIENKAKVRTCRNKSKVSSSSGSSTQIDAITALTKQVKALISSMQEAYNRNQEALIQLMQTQMGQIEEAFQERPLEEEEEPKTITEVVQIASSKSTPLVPPLETLPMSAPKPKEDLETNPHQLLIQEEKFQALENPMGRANHFVYRIDIVDSLCDKFPIENNYMTRNPTPSSDSVIESTSPSPIPCVDSDSLMEETDILLSNFDDSPPEYETFSFDIKEKSSGSTIIHSDYSLPDYDAFYFDDDHIKEKSSGGTTTHSDFSLPEYDLFIFDL
ncbi:hypothetical protein Tco_1219084 [Tanacetum coccineum]